MDIHNSMNAIMRDVDAIGKDRRNSAQGYSFRGIDDVYNDLHSVLSKHGVYTTSKILGEKHEERTTSKGGCLIYRVLTIEYTFHALDGSQVSSVVVGEGMDSGDKASNKAMAVAHKYALLQAFCIPTEDQKDPENDSHDIVPSQDEQSILCESIAIRYNVIGDDAINAYLSDPKIKLLAPGGRWQSLPVKILERINSDAFEKSLSKWLDEEQTRESK